MNTPFDEREIRQIVREALLSRQPAQRQAEAPAHTRRGGAPTVPAAAVREVSINSDDDLRRFSLELLEAADGGALAAQIRDGEVRLTLQRANAGAAAPRRHCIEHGVLSEVKLKNIAAAGDTVTVAAGVAVTPLARDWAARMRIILEKAKP